MLVLTDVRGFAHKLYRSRAGLWVPWCGMVVPKHQNVLAVLRRPEGKILIPASNIVTDAGDLHYAQRAVSEALTNAFGIGEMASAGTPGKAATRAGFTLIAGSQKAHASTYPKRNDADADNTGGGVDIVTFLQSYAKADFNHTAITHGIITNVTPAAAEPILTGYAFAAAFAKTADDTLKVFVNHTFNGV